MVKRIVLLLVLTVLLVSCAVPPISYPASVTYCDTTYRKEHATSNMVTTVTETVNTYHEWKVLINEIRSNKMKFMGICVAHRK